VGDWTEKVSTDLPFLKKKLKKKKGTREDRGLANEKNRKSTLKIVLHEDK